MFACLSMFFGGSILNDLKITSAVLSATQYEINEAHRLRPRAFPCVLRALEWLALCVACSKEVQSSSLCLRNSFGAMSPKVPLLRHDDSFINATKRPFRLQRTIEMDASEEELRYVNHWNFRDGTISNTTCSTKV